MAYRDSKDSSKENPLLKSHPIIGTIDQDSTDSSQMVLAAKYGEWSKAFSVIDRKPYLINSIPEEQTWGALHYAAWHQNEEVVRKMLAYPTCDSQIKTKQGENNKTGPGKTPMWIAQHVEPNKHIASILDNFLKNEREKRFGGTIPTYATAKDGEKMDKEGLPLLCLALANYKQTFHPGEVTPHVTFRNLLKQVFDYVDVSSHWSSAMEKTSSSVYAFDKASADYLSSDVVFPNTTDEQRFYARAVKLYTKDHIYREVNTSLRRQSQGSTYKPTADDLALGPYTLLLDTLLFYWSELNPVSTTTYRGMTLGESDIKMYAKGTQFVWLNFVSSSLDKSIADTFGGNTIFEISNDAPDAAFWRPRDLSHPLHDLHEYKEEKEALYPAGAEFLVTAVDKIDGKRRIKLRLMSPA